MYPEASGSSRRVQVVPIHPPEFAPTSDVAICDVEECLNAVFLQERSRDRVVVLITVIKGQEYRILWKTFPIQQVIVEFRNAKHLVLALQQIQVRIEVGRAYCKLLRIGGQIGHAVIQEHGTTAM